MNRLNNYTGDQQPVWTPKLAINVNSRGKVKKYLKAAGLSGEFSEFFYVVDRFLDAKSCTNLIEEFNRQIVHPVSVSGYGHLEDGDIGSFRANAWSVALAQQLSLGFKDFLFNEDKLVPLSGKNDLVFLNRSNERIRMPLARNDYQLLGSTPFMRFMKYPSGGRHVPHYDAPYLNKAERYATLMSWVLYLNTPLGSGGEFQFIDDGQWELSPMEKSRSDWQRMATEKEILESIAPVEGRLLVFPHWLPHQVALYSGVEKSCRYIIRGDVAYGY